MHSRANDSINSTNQAELIEFFVSLFDRKLWVISFSHLMFPSFLRTLSVVSIVSFYICELFLKHHSNPKLIGISRSLSHSWSFSLFFDPSLFFARSMWLVAHLDLFFIILVFLRSTIFIFSEFSISSAFFFGSFPTLFAIRLRENSSSLTSQIFQRDIAKNQPMYLNCFSHFSNNNEKKKTVQTVEIPLWFCFNQKKFCFFVINA